MIRYPVGGTAPFAPTAGSLTATGNSQATALPLNPGTSIVTTVAVGTGVILTSSVAGTPFIVANQGANPLAVYPPVGSSIIPLSVNAAANINAGETLTFVSNGDGTFLSFPLSLLVASPLYFSSGVLSFDSNAAGIAILGSAPVLSYDMSGLLSLAPTTLGDWSATTDFTGSYVSIIGNIASLIITVSSTATFTTASGNLTITGLPFTSKVSNQGLVLSALTGFSGFTAPPSVSGEPTGFYGRLVGTSLTLGLNRLNGTPSSVTTSNITSGAAFSFNITGSVLTT